MRQKKLIYSLLFRNKKKRKILIKSKIIHSELLKNAQSYMNNIMYLSIQTYDLPCVHHGMILPDSLKCECCFWEGVWGGWYFPVGSGVL